MDQAPEEPRRRCPRHFHLHGGCSSFDGSTSERLPDEEGAKARDDTTVAITKVPTPLSRQQGSLPNSHYNSGINSNNPWVLRRQDATPDFSDSEAAQSASSSPPQISPLSPDASAAEVALMMKQRPKLSQPPPVQPPPSSVSQASTAVTIATPALMTNHVSPSLFSVSPPEYEDAVVTTPFSHTHSTAQTTGNRTRKPRKKRGRRKQKFQGGAGDQLEGYVEGRRKRRKKRKKRRFCLEQTLENFRTFCEQTSLHGWQYIAQSHTSMKNHVFWGVIVLLSMLTASAFLYNNTMNFLNSTVVTTVDTMTVPLTKVYFPSVVVCNINQVRKSFFEELGIYDNETFIRQIYYDYIEGKSNQQESLYHSNTDSSKIALHEKILKEYLERKNEKMEAEHSINWVTHQKCKDMFILSKWNSTTTYFFEIERDFGTDYGICCWYTPQLNFSLILEHQREHNLSEPHWGPFFTNIARGAKTGKDNGYTMLFDIESFDYSYYDEGSEGLKVAVVHHLDMPIMRQTGFHIAPGTENQIAVTPTLIRTSENAMSRFTPEERDCYSEEEISLKYLPRDHGYRYEMSNCLFESAFENILEKCKCFPGFHTMGGEHAMEHYDVCIGPNLTCMNDLLNRMGQFDKVEYKGTQVKCRSSCTDQINSLFVTTSSYPNRKTLIYREEFCILARRLLEKCKGPKRKPLEREYPGLCSLLKPLEQIDFCRDNNWDVRRHTIPGCERGGSVARCPIEEAILDYARQNLVMFNIFIKDPYAKRFKKDEKITKTAYIANSGGLLGLCMGFSFISGAEILFHSIIGLASAVVPSLRRKVAREQCNRHQCSSDEDREDEESEADRDDEIRQQQQQQQQQQQNQSHHCHCCHQAQQLHRHHSHLQRRQDDHGDSFNMRSLTTPSCDFHPMIGGDLLPFRLYNQPIQQQQRQHNCFPHHQLTGGQTVPMSYASRQPDVAQLNGDMKKFNIGPERII